MVTKKQLHAFIKDEKMGRAEYLHASRTARLKTDKAKFRRLADDEGKHQRVLESMIGVPKRDGSGRGRRTSKGRGGHTPRKSGLGRRNK